LNGRPLSAEVRAAITEALSSWGNPSSLHAEGRAAAQARERARARVAALIGARGEEIFFTSSGTEANAWALTGLAAGARAKGNHLIVSVVEHLSILQTVRRMEKEGWSVTILPVDRAGRVEPERLESALTPQTVLVSIQWANPEVGTLQPVAEIVRRVKARGILFHTDAVAAAGRVPVSVAHVPADALSLAANTFGGPPGVGALFIRKGVRIQPFLIGGTQEEGRRAGTENLSGIVGMGEAAEASARELPSFSERVTPLRERLVRGILNLIPEANLNGDPTERFPGHISVSFPGADSEALVLALDREGVSVGLGSACSSKAVKASHVLKAMGMEDSRALGTIMMTLGGGTTEEDLERVLRVLPGALAVAGKEIIRT